MKNWRFSQINIDIEDVLQEVGHTVRLNLSITGEAEGLVQGKVNKVIDHRGTTVRMWGLFWLCPAAPPGVSGRLRKKAPRRRYNAHTSHCSEVVSHVMNDSLTENSFILAHLHKMWGGVPISLIIRFNLRRTWTLFIVFYIIKILNRLRVVYLNS